MSRKLHSVIGILAALFISITAATGVVLSIEPAIEKLDVQNDQLNVAGHNVVGTNVAIIASIAHKTIAGVALVKRSANGKITAENGSGDRFTIDLANQVAMPASKRSGLFKFASELHRSFLIGENGKIIVGISALFMLVLSISGLFLIAKRMGGWGHYFAPAKGTPSQRLHVECGRYGVCFLLISSITGLYLTFVSFGLVPHQVNDVLFPENVIGTEPLPIAELHALQNVDASDFRSLTFPYPDDQTDAYLLQTIDGQGYIDQASGQLINFQAHSTSQTMYEFFYMLHSGQGMWWLGIVLGIAALTIPLLTATGMILWFKGTFKKTTKIRGIPSDDADTIILVGSENGSTWDFANILQKQLIKKGAKVYLTKMNSFGPHLSHAKDFFFLTATHGNGDAPHSASKFLSQIGSFKPRPGQYACVLGFGDRTYENFCGFAKTAEEQLIAHDWQIAVPMHKVDRQSSEDFLNWGKAFRLDLQYQPQLKKTSTVKLMKISSYGEMVQAPVKYLRFKSPSRFKSLPKFQAGDIVGITPPNSDRPRYYSLASSSKDGFLDICVTKQLGGLCSGYLHQMEMGDQIEIFAQDNSKFRISKEKIPHILIGAGTGIAPFLGFIRNNKTKTPLHLYWGGRHEKSDFIGSDFLHNALSNQTLTSLNTAFSRQGQKQYIQDRLLQDPEVLRDLITNGAKIMVCGGIGMAQGVRTALDTILTTTEFNTQTLKQAGQYVEDVY